MILLKKTLAASALTFLLIAPLQFAHAFPVPSSVTPTPTPILAQTTTGGPVSSGASTGAPINSGAVTGGPVNSGATTGNCTNGTVPTAQAPCAPCPNGGTSSVASLCPEPGNTVPGSTSGTGLQNPLQAQDLQTLLLEILGYVQLIGGIFLTLAIVFVGFKFVTARGNPEEVGKARSALMWTVIGGLLLLGAQAIAIVISSTVQSL